jgi:ABC-type nitrate/sulfonate/bicarbonate transport system substrate-binding protein
MSRVVELRRLSMKPLMVPTWTRCCCLWLCIACASWCVLAGSARAATLTLAVADIPYTAPVLIAEAEGYFAAEGLSLDIKHYALGRMCMERLLAGEAHFATSADVPIVLASFTRRDFGILATTTLSGRENQMVIRTDRGIETAADLKGKRLGLIAGTSVHYFADTFLLFHGVKAGSVTQQELDPKDRAASIVRGDVDAAALFGPMVGDALQRLGPQGRILKGPSFFSVSFNLVSRTASAGVSDEDAEKLLRAVQRAMVLIQQDPDRALAIVAKSLKVPVDRLSGSWNDFDFRLHLSQPLITTLEAQARWAMRSGLVKEREMPDYLDLVRSEPLTRLDPRSVRIAK